jgi:hypothetical protein
MGARVKNRKRVFGIFLAAALAMALLPFSAVSAYAAADVTIGVSGITDTIPQIKAAIESAILLLGVGGGTVTVDGTLNLAPATLEFDIPSGVTVKWDAKLTADDSYPSPLSNTLIQLTGSGDFEVTTNGEIITTYTGSDWLAPISSSGNVIISGGTVSATGDSIQAVGAGGDVTVNGGTVTATGDGSWAVGADGDVTVNGGTVSADGSDSAAVSADGDVAVNGGTVSADGDESMAIRAVGDVAVNGGTVSADGEESTAIRANGNVAVSSGTVSASGDDSWAVVGGNNITVSGGTVSASGAGSYTIVGMGNSTTKVTVTSGAKIIPPDESKIHTPYGAVRDIDLSGGGGGSSGSGGCDAGLGFAGLMAMAGIALLRRKG